MGKNEVERFLSFLAEKKKVAAATQKQALNALRLSQLPEEAGLFSKYSIASPTRYKDPAMQIASFSGVVLMACFMAWLTSGIIFIDFGTYISL